MNKYRALFIEESREHLSQLATLLVSLEKSGASIDECFRHIHSVKGMAASMGYDPIAILAHRFEDVVEVYRRRQKPVHPSTVDLFLRTVDALTEQVEAIAEQKPLAEHIELIRELTLAEERELDESETPRPEPASFVSTLTPGKKHLRARVAESSSAPAVRGFMLYRALDRVAKVDRSLPPLDVIRGGDVPDRLISFWFADGADWERLRAAAASAEDIEDVEVVEEAVVEGLLGGEGSSDQPVAESSTDTRSRGVTPATLRVRVDILDRLIDGVGELFIIREQLRSLIGADKLQPQLRATLDALESRVRDLHGEALKIRMTPLGTLTDRYPRIVRDLARSLGKEVEFRVEGDQIELDRAILEALDTPFLHTLRNAVDHGIEPLGERADAQKRGPAQLRLIATRDRDTVVVTIQDDGRGLNPEDLKRVAIERGLLSEGQAAGLSAREAYFLICLPGFSTKDAVSDVSGRGVGMDVVRSEIEKLSGTLDIESELGRGTRFIFRLPLTLAIINALVVEVVGRRFAIPVAKIVAVREVGEDAVDEAGGMRYLSFRHALAPIFPLAEVLGLGAQRHDEQVVVFEDGRDLAALAVERIVGYHEIVVKPLGEPLDQLEWYSGATVLGDGEPILILDLLKLLRVRLAAG
ncbi:MAG: chemotaxis protein CheA [Myxococcota bacterium]